MRKTLSGHMIVKNGIKYDYPFIESCLSILPICDEFIFVEGFGDDGTYEKMLELQSQHSKIKVFRHPWEKQHYSVLADLTNFAIEKCTCEYHWQIQADEVVHENYHESINKLIQGDPFDYAFLGVVHFYGSFQTIYKPLTFYDRFVRIARRAKYPRIRSSDDAMTLGCPDSDPANYRCVEADHIQVHHYGFVRNPSSLIAKQEDMRHWWGFELDPMLKNAEKQGKIEWTDKFSPDKLNLYSGTHPKVLLNWITEREDKVKNGKIEN